MRELLGWAKDIIYVETEIKFDLRDRINILLCGRAWVRTSTQVDNPVGKALTEECRVTTASLPNALRHRFGPKCYGEVKSEVREPEQREDEDEH